MAINKESLGEVVFRGRIVAQLFPKPKDGEAGSPGHDFGIFKVAVTEVPMDVEQPPVENEVIITVRNLYSPLQRRNVYSFRAMKTWEPAKSRIGYDVIKINVKVDLSNPDNMNTFLRSILTKGQAENIFAELGNPYTVLESHDLDSLMKVKGIGPSTANRIMNKYNENRDTADLKVSLKDYNFSDKMLNRLTNAYGNSETIIDIVCNHPYRLIQDVDGIGFKRADEIAAISGIDKKSPERVQGFIVYYLQTQANEYGHSYVSSAELKDNIHYAFGGRDKILENYYDDQGNLIGNNIKTAMQGLTSGPDPVVTVDDKRRVYLTRMWNLENEIVHHLKRLMSRNDVTNDEWRNEMEAAEEKQGFKFSEEQLDGIEIGIENPVCIISGLAGSGKSSLVSGILAGLKDYHFAQCALSGKAAARLQEVTGQTGMTIHRLLGYSMGAFTFNEENPLPYDIIILDEISLVGGEIFLSLLKAIKTGSKLIMLGDLGQLEAIGTLNLAADLSNSPYIPGVNLKVVHRQKELSGIISTAHKVRHNMPICDPFDEGQFVMGTGDMMLDLSEDNLDCLDRAIDWFNKLYKGNIMDMQMIAPVKDRGSACVKNLNNAVQEIVNPLKKGETFLEINGYNIHKGDKVMCIKNNYDTLTPDGKLVNPIYNGWTGIVEEIDRKDNMIIINFPLALSGPLVAINIQDAYDLLVLGYASTVHKLQGSSAKIVIGVVDSATIPKMLTCELLYTLITRAKDYCVLVGQTGPICKAVLTDNVPYKQTFLPELLDKEMRYEQGKEKTVNETAEE